MVGVPLRVVRQLGQIAPVFHEECVAALEYRADKLAYELPGSPRPVGGIVELKRHRPGLYIERAINLTVNADVPGPPPADVDAALARMLTYDDLETRAMRGEVIEAPPPPHAIDGRENSRENDGENTQANGANG